jgi:predicted RNase H-like HicB family nuclease
MVARAADPDGVDVGDGVGGLRTARLVPPRGPGSMTYRIRLLETEEGWAVSCLDLPGCHSQGNSREEALTNIREAITLWLEVEADETGVKSVETLELAV